MTTTTPSHYTSTRTIVKEYKAKGLKIQIHGIEYKKNIPVGWGFVIATMPSPVLHKSIDYIFVAFSAI